MGIANNQITTVGNLMQYLNYRVDTSNTKYATSSKCVTEAMLTGLASSSTSTAEGRRKHTKVDVSPLKISQSSISISSVSSMGLSSSSTSRTLITFTTPNNVGGNTSCSFSETISYTLKLVSGVFLQSTPETTITSTAVLGTLFYPGGKSNISVQISQNTTTQASFNIPSFNVANLLPNEEYTVTLSLYTASNIGAGAVKATLTPSVRTATLNYYCHNKLVQYRKLENDCNAEVPFMVKISNAKNVKTKFDTVKLSLKYMPYSDYPYSTLHLITKEWNEIPSNDSKSSVIMVPIRNASIPVAANEFRLEVWAGEAGAKQDIRIGSEWGTSTIEYGSYANCKTRTDEFMSYDDRNGLADILQSLTGVVYNVK